MRLIFDTDIGNAIKHTARSMQQDYRYAARHPLVEAYDYYRGLRREQRGLELIFPQVGDSPMILRREIIWTSQFQRESPADYDSREFGTRTGNAIIAIQKRSRGV